MPGSRAYTDQEQQRQMEQQKKKTEQEVRSAWVRRKQHQQQEKSHLKGKRWRLHLESTWEDEEKAAACLDPQISHITCFLQEMSLFLNCI